VSRFPDDRWIIPAAGAVLWRDGRVAVVRRVRYDDCSLPKGKLEAGESFEAAAVREVEEETGTVGRITGFLRAVDYPVTGKRKLVVFFEMEAEREGRSDCEGEIAAVQWLPPEEALEALEYPLEREVLRSSLEARSGRDRAAP
jgi:8-oxo-dGTP diphosphatase